MESPTAKQVKALVEILREVTNSIKEAGPNGLVSGHLYATLMPTGISLNSYNQMIETLQRAKLVKLSNNVLTYIGPK